MPKPRPTLKIIVLLADNAIHSGRDKIAIDIKRVVLKEMPRMGGVAELNFIQSNRECFSLEGRCTRDEPTILVCHINSVYCKEVANALSTELGIPVTPVEELGFGDTE
jgi:hypothetical protein